MLTLCALNQGAEALSKGGLRPSRHQSTTEEPEAQGSERSRVQERPVGPLLVQGWVLSQGCTAPLLTRGGCAQVQAPEATPPPAHLPGLRFLPSRGCSPVCSEEGNCKLIFISILEENLNSPH